MWQKRILVRDSDSVLADRIENNIRKNCSIGYARANSYNFEIVELRAVLDMEDWTNDIVAYNMIEYYKYKYLSGIVNLNVWNAEPNKTADSVLLSTLVSCLVYYDIGGQVRQISKILDTMRDNICLDGLYNFRMQSIKDSWGEMGEMLEDMEDLAITDKDILLVTKNLYEVGKDKTRRAIIESAEDKGNCRYTIRQLMGAQREVVEIENIWQSEEENIIATLIKRRIGVVEIDKKPNSLPMDILKNLFLVKGVKQNNTAQHC